MAQPGKWFYKILRNKKMYLTIIFQVSEVELLKETSSGFLDRNKKK